MPGKETPNRDFRDDIKDMKRRLRELEAASRLQEASIQDGAISVYDSADALRAKFGKLGTNIFGVEVYDAEGDVRVRIGRDGSFYGGRAWDGQGPGVNDPLWDTGFKNLRIVSEGETTADLSVAAPASVEVTLTTHSLGFIPIVFAWHPSSGGVYEALPSDAVNASGVVTERHRILATSTLVKIRRDNLSGPTSQTGYEVRWQLLGQTLSS